MPGINTTIGIRTSIGGRGSSSRNWTPLTLVVEDAQPTHVVITFPSAKTVLASDFTIAGITATVLSGSWTGLVYTLVLDNSVAYGNIISVVYKGKSYSVTNNVSIYLSDLVTRHSGVRSGNSLIESIGGLNASIIPPMAFFDSTSRNLCRTNLSLSGETDVDFTTWFWRDSTSKKVSLGIDEGSKYFDFMLWDSGIMYLQVGAGSYGTISTSVTGLHKYRIKFLGSGAANADRLKIWEDDVPKTITFSGTIPSSIPTMGTYWTFNSGHAASYFTDGAIGETSMKINGTLAHLWPMSENQGLYCFDVVGTAHGVFITGTDPKYVAKYVIGGGSTHLMDYGYSVFQKTGYLDEYVPYTLTGIAQNPTALSTYSKRFVSPDIAGSSNSYNNAPALIDFDPTVSGDARLINFKRSDTTVFSATARLGLYDSGFVYRWHISELNKYKMLAFYNSGYKNKVFPKMVGDSLNERAGFNEILNYSTDKVNIELNNVLSYTSDFTKIYLNVVTSDLHICATRGDKILAFDDVNTLSLSLDKGVTYAITKNVGLSIITFAHIFDNGNIIFADQTKVYLSTDNLSSFAETSVKNIGGTAYSPYATANYTVWQYDYATINGIEVLVFCNYQAYVNAVSNAWYSVDNGVTIKSFMTNTGGHWHGMMYDKIRQVWIATFGDIDEIRELSYNTTTDTWTLLRTIDLPLNIGFGRKGNYYYWWNDKAAGVTFGCYRVGVNDLADHATKKELIYTTPSTFFQSLDGWVDYDEGIIYCFHKAIQRIIYSCDGVKFFELDYVSSQAIMNTSGGGVHTTHADNNHNYLAQIIKNTTDPTFIDYTKGKVYLVKICKVIYG